MPSFCMYPFPTNLALFRTTTPSSSFLFLKTHLVPIMVFPYGRCTGLHTFICSNWLSSSCMAVTQSESERASEIVVDLVLLRKAAFRHSFAVGDRVLIGSEGSPITCCIRWLRVHFVSWLDGSSVVCDAVWTSSDGVGSNWKGIGSKIYEELRVIVSDCYKWSI